MNRFIGEVTWFAFNETPANWKACKGTLLPESQNQALFGLLGTTYGENRLAKQFALPNLQGSVPVNAGQLNTKSGENFELGKSGGEAVHVLTPAEMAIHTHPVVAATEAASSPSPGHNLWAGGSSKTPFANEQNNGMGGKAVTYTGGDPDGPNGNALPHENRPPFVALNYSICTQGIFPSRDGGHTELGFLGEIAMFAGDFAPSGWAFCHGQELPLGSNTALYAVLGTTYGGNGTTTFKLPDMRGRAVVGAGAGKGLTPREVGETGGTTKVQLTLGHMPSHTHFSQGTSTAGNTNDPTNATWAVASDGNRGGVPIYAPAGQTIAMNTNALANAGGDQPHNNLAPYQALNYIICIGGEFPPRG